MHQIGSPGASSTEGSSSRSATLARSRRRTSSCAFALASAAIFVSTSNSAWSSPDLNPIEQSFAKLKAHLRKANERTIPALYDCIGRALQTFQPNEFPNYFGKAGYAPI